MNAPLTDADIYRAALADLDASGPVPEITGGLNPSAVGAAVANATRAPESRRITPLAVQRTPIVGLKPGVTAPRYLDEPAPWPTGPEMEG